MSLSALDLKDSILGKIQSLSDEDKTVSLTVHSAYADGIKEYVLSNLKLNGAYIGTLTAPPNPPDPLNGPSTWEAASCTMTGALLMSGASTSLELWFKAIETGLKSLQFAGGDITGLVQLAAPVALSVFSLDLSDSDISGLETMEDVVEVIATKIIDSLTSTDVSSLVSPAMTAGGVGTVTMNSIT